MQPITRRTFLGSSLAGGAALSTPGLRCLSAPLTKPIGANDEIRVAVIGMGGFDGVGGRGRQLIARLKQVGGVRLTALCDVDESLLQHEHNKLDRRAEIKTYRDMRNVFDDKEIDAVLIALPNHWHALATIWACQAGKDVYVEKPASYNIWEGRQMVNAARKYNRIVQTGTQARSADVDTQLAEYVRGGELGEVKLARAIIYRRRESIGKVTGPQPVPASVDYDLWLGPAPKTKLMRRELHYLWHWDWATGNGEIGNNGVHYLDRCRWILGQAGLPRRAMSVGGRYQFADDGQTPNTQIAFLDYDPAPIICEVRGLPEKRGSKKMDTFRGIDKGIIIECEGGSLVSDRKTSTAYDSDGRALKSFQDRRGQDASPSPHQENFFAAVRSRKASDLNAEILDGHLSAALCHMANISQRLGTETQPSEIVEMTKGDPRLADAFQRFQQHTEASGIDLTKTPAALGPWVTIDSGEERFVGQFAERANQLCRREYRKPFIVNEQEGVT
jgi:predicted dehydrogenase